MQRKKRRKNNIMEENYAKMIYNYLVETKITDVSHFQTSKTRDTDIFHYFSWMLQQTENKKVTINNTDFVLEFGDKTWKYGGFKHAQGFFEDQYIHYSLKVGNLILYENSLIF